MGRKILLQEAKNEFVKRGYTPLFENYNSNNEKLLAKTKEGYKISIKLSNLKTGNIPSLFHKDNAHTIYNIKLWLKLNNKNYELLSTEYTKNNILLDWSCNIHGEFKMTWEKMHQGCTCKECNKIKSFHSFKIELGTIFKDDKRNLIITDRKYQYSEKEDRYYKIYKYRCYRCGYECGENYKNGKYNEDYWIAENSLLRGNGCSCCCTPTQIVVEHINSITSKEETHWMVTYFQGGYDEAKMYTKCSNQKIIPICPDCGRVKDKKISINDIYRKKGIGCICGDGFSYGHKYIHNLLTQLNLSFEDNKTFDWCKFYNIFKNKEVTGEYDFIIEDIKLIIEVDGGFHRGYNNMSNQTEEESKHIDLKKDILAKENGYKIIRVVYDDNNKEIKKYILSSKLGDIFNFDNIDWSKCEESALSNKSKEVCNLWNSEDYSTIEISEKLNINYSTIIDYLNYWHKIGMCNYDSKKELKKAQQKGIKKMIESTSKKVEIFKDNMLLGTFNSCSELSRQSEKMFGVKLTTSSISRSHKNNKENKGFIIKII